jgi:hypothetical protein
MSDEKQNLDGKTPVKVVPFDAHERAQAALPPNTSTPNSRRRSITSITRLASASNRS